MPVGQYEAAVDFRIQQKSDIFTYHSSAGDQTHPSVGDKRSHHTGQGYFSCLCDCRIGDVYDRKALASSQTSMVPYVAAGIFYYVFNFLVAWIMEKIEKHLSYYR